MAAINIRPFPIYYKGKKIAEVESGSYDILPNAEMQIGTEGYLGHSDGAITTKLEATCIVPVKGVSVTMLGDCLANKSITIGIFADGKLQQMDMRCTGISYSWDTKNGKATGKFSFEGGPPDVTGLLSERGARHVKRALL